MKIFYLFNINYIHFKRVSSEQILIALSSRCKAGVTYYTFEDFWETTGLTAALVCRYSTIELKCTCNYIDGSHWHFEFPKVMLAHI